MVKLKRFELGELLGKGASAEVYRAIQKDATALPAAVKVFNNAYVDQLPDFPERFERECKTIAELNHSGVVRVLTGDIEDGHYYIAMELLSGGSLASRLGINAINNGKSPEGAHEKLDPMRALTLLHTLADVLVYTAEQGKIHRDIKPANIMFRAEASWAPVLADFGIAKSTQTDQSLTVNLSLIGSPLYMSPEQIVGQQLCAKTDIFSLGVVFYQMIMGRLPFPGAVADAKPEQIIGAMMSQHEAGAPVEPFDSPDQTPEEKEALKLCQSIWSKMLRPSVKDRIDAQSLVKLIDQALVVLKGELAYEQTVFRNHPIADGKNSAFPPVALPIEDVSLGGQVGDDGGKGKWRKIAGSAVATVAVAAIGMVGYANQAPMIDFVSRLGETLGFNNVKQDFSKAEFDAYMAVFQPGATIEADAFEQKFPDSIFSSLVKLAATRGQDVLAQIQSKADNGDKLAQFQLAEIYSEHPFSPFPVESNKALALEWAERSNGQNFFPAKMQVLFLEEKVGRVAVTSKEFSDRLNAIKTDSKCQEGCKNIVDLVQGGLRKSTGG